MTRAAIHIVDDDPDIRDGLAWLFDSRGYRATTWASGGSLTNAFGNRHGAAGSAQVSSTGVGARADSL